MILVCIYPFTVMAGAALLSWKWLFLMLWFGFVGSRSCCWLRISSICCCSAVVVDDAATIACMKHCTLGSNCLCTNFTSVFDLTATDKPCSQTLKRTFHSSLQACKYLLARFHEKLWWLLLPKAHHWKHLGHPHWILDSRARSKDMSSDRASDPTMEFQESFLLILDYIELFILT